LSVAEVLNWPGVLGDDRSAALREACVALVQELLEDFAATRSREGGKLATMLTERAERMKSLLASIQPKLPEAIAAYEESWPRVFARCSAARTRRRIRQEIAPLRRQGGRRRGTQSAGGAPGRGAPRSQAGGAVGKRLDFLMQELNREANTLGSKSVSKEISDSSLEFKLLIEQMREQIQNIE